MSRPSRLDLGAAFKDFEAIRMVSGIGGHLPLTPNLVEQLAMDLPPLCWSDEIALHFHKLKCDDSSCHSFLIQMRG